ncbi:thiol-disulfide oxidoreductase LTO1 isoform X2 [Phalaenopsis equestris]|uniref:thiol-disulfide oxidoreductase LTO1 isoform X2 n=1 Tax=Phalaenopsis equestris TaxID=78828 RepID=UPI0009E47C16|nr:thiol-disulfide oxidoreductase LTO1 isoform X2 [Phalaenopsis equestris]
MGISSALAISRPPFLPSISCPLASPLRFKQRTLLVSLRCWCGPSPKLNSDSETSDKSFSLGMSKSSWCAALGAVGFLETAYLTYLKLSNSEAFCAIGGGGCNDVLNSEYSYVFGVPLPLVGMVSYGLVTLLSVQQSGKNLIPGIGEIDVRFLLLGITTSMATASAYFLYLLGTKLPGTSCSYCLISVFISFSLLFITLKDYALEELQKFVGLQLAIAAIVVATLSNSYTITSPKLPGSSDMILEPYETEITEQSTTWTIALAKHLHSIGAKMYGAFWCSHCVEQKQMFGREAAKILDYIECFPEGVGKGRKMAQECTLTGLEGFPTWIIKGKVLSGQQNLQALADASEFVSQDSSYQLASKQNQS